MRLVAIPVTDVDRAIASYTGQVGYHLDFDHHVSDEVRFVELTPPGSACSIVLGMGITEMAPGSQKGLQGVISDADAAPAQLREKGVDAGDVQDLPWGRFVFFADPDGNLAQRRDAGPQRWALRLRRRQADHPPFRHRRLCRRDGDPPGFARSGFALDARVARSRYCCRCDTRAVLALTAASAPLRFLA
jgi:catechol 2,3-dioxygenase-like lactoylglutathione lyase family enzyme